MARNPLPIQLLGAARFAGNQTNSMKARDDKRVRRGAGAARRDSGEKRQYVITIFAVLLNVTTSWGNRGTID